MKNPLRKRLKRELVSELGKYLVIFILITGMIGMVSGFLVADDSIVAAYDASFEKYNIEDGLFEVKDPLTKSRKNKIEKNNITIYENYYVELEGEDGNILRVFENRDQVDLACIMDGRLANAPGEIAIDRMYADNNKLSVGDSISMGSGEYEIVGLVALPDYSALFENNSDTMFDALKFAVAVVDKEQFDSYNKAMVTYRYSWKYNEAISDVDKESKVSENLMSEINSIVALQEFIPRYINNAIMYSGTDLTGDRAMMLTLLYILIAIVGFVFAVITANTLEKESAVIGTLRATGYSRGEIVRHFLAMPCFVTIAGALAGNILGYTYFKVLMADLYYASYSLVSYTTILNANAFWQTTVIPLLMILVINYFILSYMMKLSPLKFIRRDLRRRGQKRGTCGYKAVLCARF